MPAEAPSLQPRTHAHAGHAHARACTSAIMSKSEDGEIQSHTLTFPRIPQSPAVETASAPKAAPPSPRTSRISWRCRVSISGARGPCGRGSERGQQGSEAGQGAAVTRWTRGALFGPTRLCRKVTSRPAPIPSVDRSENGIGSEGCMALAEPLEKLTALQALTIRCMEA